MQPLYACSDEIRRRERTINHFGADERGTDLDPTVATMRLLLLLLLALLTWPSTVWHSFQARRRLRAHARQLHARFTLERVA